MYTSIHQLGRLYKLYKCVAVFRCYPFPLRTTRQPPPPPLLMLSSCSGTQSTHRYRHTVPQIYLHIKTKKMRLIRPLHRSIHHTVGSPFLISVFMGTFICFAYLHESTWKEVVTSAPSTHPPDNEKDLLKTCLCYYYYYHPPSPFYSSSLLSSNIILTMTGCV